MKLTTLKIKNFRSYAGEHVIKFDPQFTAFIGKNDVGKSTVFDALEVFFGNSKPDLGDLCISAEDRVLEITCTFSELPESLELDTSASTTLAEEHLLNNFGELEIKKVFKCTAKTVATSPEIFIGANYPALSQVRCLHMLDQKKLKELGESMSVTVDDARVNNLWRKAIWEAVEDLRLEFIYLKIDDFETKAKKIYSKVEENIPLFFVFRADREMTDSDAEAKDPMQLAVAEAQLEFQTEIDSIKERIQERVQEVAASALERLHEVDARLADQLNPVLKSKPTWKFDYKIEDDRGVALNKRGSGTRRLVLLNFFRAQAEKRGVQASKGIIYAIEEPETSQHPDNQKLIISALTELAGDVSRQVAITTHSPELLREVENDFSNGIRFIQTTSDGHREVIFGNDALLLAAQALSVLSPQMFGSARKVVLVEGKKDCLFLEHAARAMKDAGELNGDFSDNNIEALPVGGCHGVIDWVDSEKYIALGLPTFVFMDSDRLGPTDPRTRNEAFIAQLSARDNIEGFCTLKREIENYIPTAISGSVYTDYDDAKNIISTTQNKSAGKVIDDYWTQVTAADIDQEIKNIITAICA